MADLNLSKVQKSKNEQVEDQIHVDLFFCSKEIVHKEFEPQNRKTSHVCETTHQE